MSAYQFGVGRLYGRRTDVTPATPVELGVLQDVSLDFKSTLKKLMGQNKWPVDVAQGESSISIKAKAARIQCDIWNNLFFGQTQTIATGGLQLVSGESATVASTVTVVHAASFKEDLGVTYGATGIALEKVTSAPAVGQYSVNEATGVYTFNAGDVAVVGGANFNYTWTSAGVTQTIAIANQVMGAGPSFEMHLGQSYKNNAGTLSTPYYKFNACKASDLSVPFKNGDYAVWDLTIEAFADSAGNIGSIVLTE